MDTLPSFAFPTQEDLQAELQHREFEKGGDFNNIPPSISQKVSGSEDTAVIGCGVSWGESFDNVMALLELRKQEARGPAGETAAVFGDYRFAVAASGFSAGGYVAYQLTASGVRFGIAATRSPHGETPNFYIRMGSAVLMYNDGIEPVWWYVQEVIKAMGGELLWHKVSRVDLCVDLWDVEVRELHEDYRQGCVTRAKYKVTYEWGLSLSGFVLGKGDVQLRIYDKRLESERDPTKWDILQARRCPDDWDGRVCTRVEFQLRREFLKSFGVHTINDWLAFRGGIADYLTTQWCRICEPITDRTHTTRPELSALWSRVKDDFALWCGAVGFVKRCFRDVQYNGEALFRMALGCLGRIVASKADGEIYGFEEFVTRCRQVLVDGLVTRELEELQERFILRFGKSDPYLPHEEEIGWNFSLDYD
jgi:hypothetical protein